MIFIAIFWISFAALMHTYIVYPVVLAILASRKSSNRNCHHITGEAPAVSVLMAVHNEQDVIEDKIKSILTSILPGGRVEIFVGSDASTDSTNEILEKLANEYDFLSFVFFETRRGKSAIINELVKLSREDVIVISDANVIFDRHTLFKLARHFRNPEIGLVDSHMMHRGLKKSGISIQESAYITREVRIKYFEGIIWGTMMGPFGGCYALRRELYSEVPDSFLVDDFYICMKVIDSGYKAILDPEAYVHEDVSNSLGEEFRRKVRIAAGNFQNLKQFSAFMFSGIRGLSFSFISHKVLRWLGPFFLAAVFLSALWLSPEHDFYRYILTLQIFILLLPIIDYVLGKIKMHIVILRFVTHFISMNLALLAGFVKFLIGVKSNVWHPTRRNQ